MKITEQVVNRVANLASLELSDDERVRMVRDLNTILEYMDRLDQLDTSNVEPMSQVSAGRERANRLETALRDDVLEGLRKSLPHDVALENAPDTDGVFFKVPKVIER